MLLGQSRYSRPRISTWHWSTVPVLGGPGRHPRGCGSRARVGAHGMFHRCTEQNRKKRLKYVGQGQKGVKSPQNRSAEKPRDAAGPSWKRGAGWEPGAAVPEAWLCHGTACPLHGGGWMPQGTMKVIRICAATKKSPTLPPHLLTSPSRGKPDGSHRGAARGGAPLSGIRDCSRGEKITTK